MRPATATYTWQDNQPKIIMSDALFQARLAVQTLDEVQDKFGMNQLSPVEAGTLRAQALCSGVVALFEHHGVFLQRPLRIDTNGELRLAALKSATSVPDIEGTAPFGDYLAGLLSRHMARTGIVPGHISADNGWCRINHFRAEALLREGVLVLQEGSPTSQTH